jgi:SET domain-containing protein
MENNLVSRFIEFQLERSQGKLRFPIGLNSLIKKRIKEILLSEELTIFWEEEREFDRDNFSLKKQFKINPWQLRKDRLELDLKLRLQIIDLALAATGQTETG